MGNNVPSHPTRVERMDHGTPLLGRVCMAAYRNARSQAMCDTGKLLFPPLYLPCTDSYSSEKHPSWNFPQNLQV